MGAFVPVNQAVTSPAFYGEWLPIFRRGFGLRCFQPLSSAAWLPGVCPIGQPVN